MAFVTINNDKTVTIKLVGRRGDTYEFTANVKDKNGDDYNFSNYFAKMQIKIARESDTSILELTSLNGITLSTGLLYFIISAETMKTLLPKIYYFDFQMTYPSGKVKTWFDGKFTVNQDTTR